MEFGNIWLEIHEIPPLRVSFKSIKSKIDEILSINLHCNQIIRQYFKKIQSIWVKFGIISRKLMKLNRFKSNNSDIFMKINEIGENW